MLLKQRNVMCSEKMFFSCESVQFCFKIIENFSGVTIALPVGGRGVQRNPHQDNKKYAKFLTLVVGVTDNPLRDNRNAIMIEYFRILIFVFLTTWIPTNTFLLLFSQW